MPKLNDTPSETVKNGRDQHGRFGPGNAAAKGNSAPRKAAQFRARLFDAVTLEDFAAIVAAVVKDATDGDRHARKLLFDFLLGTPQALDALAEVERLQAQVDAIVGERL